MTRMKRLIALGFIVTAVGATSVTAFAASSYSTPAEALVGITGRTIESVTEERSETGKTYGSIASDAGKLDEYQAEILEIKKDVLAERVEAGRMTQEQADEMIAAMESNQALCDGTGSSRSGQGMGAGFGGMKGNGFGGNGQGAGGYGQGMRGNGPCGGYNAN